MKFTSKNRCTWFDNSSLKRKPWIMPDEVDVVTVVKVIDTCPSGALKYRHK